MDQDTNREPGRTPHPQGAQPGSPPPADLPGGPEQPVAPETPRQPTGYPAWSPTSQSPQQPPTEGARTVQFGQPEQPLQAAPPYPTPPETRRRGMPVWAWVLTGLGLLTCLGCVGIGVLGGNLVGWFVQTIGEPAAVATEYSLALRAHNFEQAHSFFAPDLARRYSVEQLEANWLAIEERGEISGSTYESVHVENDEATVGWVLTSGRTRYETTLMLRKSGDKWQITGGDPAPVPLP